MERQQREPSKEMGPRRLGLLRARASMLGSGLDPEWSQDGPFIDPRDPTKLAVGGHWLGRVLSSYSSIH
jgi:hypothetical protein